VIFSTPFLKPKRPVLKTFPSRGAKCAGFPMTPHASASGSGRRYQRSFKFFLSSLKKTTAAPPDRESCTFCALLPRWLMATSSATLGDVHVTSSPPPQIWKRSQRRQATHRQGSRQGAEQQRARLNCTVHVLRRKRRLREIALTASSSWPCCIGSTTQQGHPSSVTPTLRSCKIRCPKDLKRRLVSLRRDIPLAPVSPTPYAVEGR